MPTLFEETEVKLDRADLLQLSPVNIEIAPRTSGLHLSGVLKYIAQTSKITNYVAQVDAEEMPLIWLLGLAWEWACVRLYPEILHQPGEVLDPVVMTCDGVSEYGIEEFKYTSKKRMSADDLMKKQWLWMQQGRGYCIGYKGTRVRWHVCYVNQPWAPVYVRYLIEFSEGELKQTEKMIRENMPRALEAGFAE